MQVKIFLSNIVKQERLSIVHIGRGTQAGGGTKIGTVQAEQLFALYEKWVPTRVPTVGTAYNLREECEEADWIRPDEPTVRKTPFRFAAPHTKTRRGVSSLGG